MSLPEGNDDSFIKIIFRRSDLLHILTLYFNWKTPSKLLETNNLKENIIKLDNKFRQYREHFDVEKNVQKGRSFESIQAEKFHLMISLMKEKLDISLDEKHSIGITPDLYVSKDITFILTGQLNKI